MEVLVLLLPLALCLGLLFLTFFLWAVNSGQYDDVETPRYKILIDEDNKRKKNDH